MSTSKEEDDEVERIYEEINNVIKTAKGEKNCIILRNYIVTMEEGKEKNIVSKYGLGISNTKEEILFESCVRINLIITNSYF